MPVVAVVVAVDITVGVVMAEGPLPVEAPFGKPSVTRAPVIRGLENISGLRLSGRRRPETNQHEAC